MSDSQTLSATRGHLPADLLTRGAAGRLGALADTLGARAIALACAVLVVLGIALQLEPAFLGPPPGDPPTLETQGASISRAITGMERELDRFLSEPRRIVAHPGIFGQLQADLKSLHDRGSLLEATISELQRASARMPDMLQGVNAGGPIAWIEATFAAANRATASALRCGRKASDGPGIRTASVGVQATSDGSLHPPRGTAGTVPSTVLGGWEILTRSEPGDHASASGRGNLAKPASDGHLDRGATQRPAGPQRAHQRESQLMPDVCSL